MALICSGIMLELPAISLNWGATEFHHFDTRLSRNYFVDESTKMNLALTTGENKMNQIKKLALALALTFTLGSTFTAPKAEAGVITVVGGIAKSDIAGVASGALVTWGGFALVDYVAQNDPWRIVGIVLIVLDAKQTLTSDGIEQYLAKKYSFIDDREVLADLANLVRSKVTEQGALQASTAVSIPESEIRAAVANSSLTATQTQTLVEALK